MHNARLSVNHFFSLFLRGLPFDFDILWSLSASLSGKLFACPDLGFAAVPLLNFMLHPIAFSALIKGVLSDMPGNLDVPVGEETVNTLLMVSAK